MTVINHRFCEVFEPLKTETPLHNRILADLDEAVLVPTLGSIIPNWLLLVPKGPALNYRSWQEAQSSDVMALVRTASSYLGVEDQKLLWFEHGAASKGSLTGCGVDYAHLHLLVDPDFSLHEFVAAVHQQSGKDWRHAASVPIFSELSPENDYYIFGQGPSAYVGSFDHSLGSQFFRRVIARLVGKDREWNYKEFPFHANIASTVRNFSATVKDAA